MRRINLIYALFWLASTMSFHFATSQDTLPKFSLYIISENKVLIQWKNPDTSLRQLSIQQSIDSAYGYRTILTMLDPRLAENGSVLNLPQASKMFYRIYLLYPRGKYLFTPSKRPVPRPTLPLSKPTQTKAERQNPPKTTSDSAVVATAPPTVSLVIQKANGKVDSLNRKDTSSQPDTAAQSKPDDGKTKTLEPIAVVKKVIPPAYASIQNDGYPFIKMPNEWDLSQVQICFFQENGELLFELTHPPIGIFRIDKTNFNRSGWYKYEIWHKNQKMDANRLYLPLEF